MDIHRLPDDEAAIRRYIEALWIPYNRELEEIGDGFSLADDVDIVAEKLEYRLSLHETESYQAWIAIDGSSGESRRKPRPSGQGRCQDEGAHADIDGDFVRFITTDIDESPAVFDCPDRLAVCDIYVEEPYRGTGLSSELVERARIRAGESGCTERRLEVDVSNERARRVLRKTRL